MSLSTGKNIEPATPASADDELLKLQLRVARRADELSQENGREPQKDLEHWLQAEREVLTNRTAVAALAQR
jgi:hypothetical protein